MTSLSWSALESRDLAILMLFEIVRILWFSVATRSLATSRPLVTRCGFASNRELAAVKDSGRGMGQRVSSFDFVLFDYLFHFFFADVPFAIDWPESATP